MKQKKKEPINVELIPVYISKEEFAEKKEEIQNLIAKILIQAKVENLKKGNNADDEQDETANST